MFVVSRDGNEKTNRFFAGDCSKNAMATTYFEHGLCSGRNPGRDGSSMEGVPKPLSVERLECWVWDPVNTQNAISVLSLALCMVIDVIFPVDGRRCHQNCWAGVLVSILLAALV